MKVGASVRFLPEPLGLAGKPLLRAPVGALTPFAPNPFIKENLRTRSQQDVTARRVAPLSLDLFWLEHGQQPTRRSWQSGDTHSSRQLSVTARCSAHNFQLGTRRSWVVASPAGGKPQAGNSPYRRTHGAKDAGSGASCAGCLFSFLQSDSRVIKQLRASAFHERFVMRNRTCSCRAGLPKAVSC